MYDSIVRLEVTGVTDKQVEVASRARSRMLDRDQALMVGEAMQHEDQSLCKAR